MDIIEAIKKRNSVRNYKERAVNSEIINELSKEIEECNKSGELNFQVFTDEMEAFNSFLARYGKFRNAWNYIVLAGKNEEHLDEKVGYYGEHIALKLQQLGLNTCWVALTFKKRKIKKLLKKDERLVCVLAFGYGATQGIAHKSKKIEEVYKADVEQISGWFKNGLEMALLAPTAINQQKFLFTLSGNKVRAESTGGVNSKIDLGIVKYHFEIGAGKENFIWAD